MAHRIVVTICTTRTYELGGKTRRFVVAPEDEHLFAPGVPDYFQARWLRAGGVVDEQVRLLSPADNIIKVKRTP